MSVSNFGWSARDTRVFPYNLTVRTFNRSCQDPGQVSKARKWPVHMGFCSCYHSETLRVVKTDKRTWLIMVKGRRSRLQKWLGDC